MIFCGAGNNIHVIDVCWTKYCRYFFFGVQNLKVFLKISRGIYLHWGEKPCSGSAFTRKRKGWSSCSQNACVIHYLNYLLVCSGEEDPRSPSGVAPRTPITSVPASHDSPLTIGNSCCWWAVLRVRSLLDPGIRNRFFFGSRIPTHIFESSVKKKVNWLTFNGLSLFYPAVLLSRSPEPRIRSVPPGAKITNSGSGCFLFTTDLKKLYSKKIMVTVPFLSLFIELSIWSAVRLLKKLFLSNFYLVFRSESSSVGWERETIRQGPAQPDSSKQVGARTHRKVYVSRIICRVEKTGFQVFPPLFWKLHEGNFFLYV